MRSADAESVLYVTINSTTMSRKEFGFLLKQYLEGKCSEEEKAFVEHWYGIVQNKDVEPVQETDLHTLEPLLWKQIQSRTQSPKVIPMPVAVPYQRFSYSWIGAIAASVALVLVVGWWFYTQQSDQPQSANAFEKQAVQAGWLRRENTTDKPLLVDLVDGSQVRLAPQSSIRYPPAFATDKREVLLTGEAFFTVQKMLTKPFLVRSGNVVTKVLGTSFLVKTQAATKQVVVEVVTGRVAVYEQANTSKPDEKLNQVVLNPNQKATYSPDNQQFTTGLVERPQPIPSAKPEVQPLSFSFDDAPLHRVVDRLEQAYGITIKLDNANLNDCPLTADLTNLTLYDQLDMICAATKSSYAVQGTTIVLSGKGCANL